MEGPWKGHGKLGQKLYSIVPWQILNGVSKKDRKWMKREENKVKNVDNLYHENPISAGRIMSQAYLHLLKHSNHDFPPLSLHCIVMPGEIDL